MNYLTEQNFEIELLPGRLGRGGEGEVLSVARNPHLVAKIFHNPTLERCSKLEFMVDNPVPQTSDHPWVAWPTEIIYTRDAHPQFAGFLMPKSANCRQLFTCYNQLLRRTQFPCFDYRSLVHCGRNLAAAVRYAHRQGHVIGDLNESNVFVTSDARVTLIDADSWQISDPETGQLYGSAFAKSEYLPRELQALDLSKYIREPCHDNFALAVLLFKLITEGCHPFDGIYQGQGDVPELESRIGAGEFPHHEESAGDWTPKDLALPFETLHPYLQELFLQAFVDGHGDPHSRPDARGWRDGFALAERELQGCHRNSNHWFWGDECVWCQRKKLLGGWDSFPGGHQPVVRKTSSASNLPQPPNPVRLPAARQSWIANSSTPAPAPSCHNQKPGWFGTQIDKTVHSLNRVMEVLIPL